MRTCFPLLPLLLSLLMIAACAVAPRHCAGSGQWVAPASLRPIADPVAPVPVTLLGETHDRDADHQWQLATIRRLYAARPALVLGFEMFPRSSQPALNAWVGGGVPEAEFLARSDWQHVWGFPPELYLPIFRFARDHRIPMLALNVSHRLVHMVASQGWDAVPPGDREGIGGAAPPTAAYRASLADAMAGHGGPAMTPERLQHFIEAQSVWDRAMAEAIAAQRAREPDRPVVALMGAGHLENRYGVPHQLDALGMPSAMVLLPAHDLCVQLSPSYADAVFVE